MADSGFEHLLAEGVISEVLGRLKSGKEADVYAVRYGGKVVAAKVYKERAHRSFKNNAVYMEGRSVRNSRSQRAMDRKTSFGQAASEEAWKSAEADAIYKLHAAEVRVPAPVMFLDGVLLMELVCDANGEAAPRLIDVHLTPADANAAYRDMLTQLVRILSCDLIHGDLSPYNVLWAAAGPTIIDFPQIISASHSSSSEAFFLRDARNILGYFAAADPSLNARRGDPMEIWRAYVRRELTPDFVPTGRSAPREHHGFRAGHEARPGQGPRDQGPRADGPRGPGPRPDRHRGNGAPRPGAPPVQAGGQPGNARPAHQGGGGPRPGGHGHGGGGGPRPGGQGHAGGGGPRPGGHAQGGGGPRGGANGHPGGGPQRGGGQRRSVHVPEVIVRINRSNPPGPVEGHDAVRVAAPVMPTAPAVATAPDGPARSEGAGADPHRRRRRRRR